MFKEHQGVLKGFIVKEIRHIVHFILLRSNRNFKNSFLFSNYHFKKVVFQEFWFWEPYSLKNTTSLHLKSVDGGAVVFNADNENIGLRLKDVALFGFIFRKGGLDFHMLNTQNFDVCDNDGDVMVGLGLISEKVLHDSIGF